MREVVMTEAVTAEAVVTEAVRAEAVVTEAGTRADTPARKPPASALIGLVVGGYAAQAVCVVARLGVADELHDGAQPAAELARRLGAHEQSLHRLLRAVADTGVVQEQDDGRFALTPLGELLRSDVPGSLRAWVSLMGMPFWIRPWSELFEAVRTGDASFARANGGHFLEYLMNDPDAMGVFEAGMSSLYTYRTVLGDYDLSRCGTVVDVGGDRGTVLAETLAANAHLRGVLTDTPEALAGAERELSRAGVADRCRVVAADIFSAVPEGGDVYLLSGMIHGAGDERAAEVLGACREAMSDDARLLVAETILPDGNQPSVGKLLDLQMLVLLDGGCFRTESQMRSLIEAAGFRVLRTVRSSDTVALVEAVRR